MTGLLICAAYVLTYVGVLMALFGLARFLGFTKDQRDLHSAYLGLALIAVALWLAYAAGGA